MKEKYYCHDCGTEIKIKNKQIINGVGLVYQSADKKIPVFKCNECYAKSKALRNYQKCEVYSRIVGYLRPINQWNEGKRNEFKDRKEYTNLK